MYVYVCMYVCMYGIGLTCTNIIKYIIKPISSYSYFNIIITYHLYTLAKLSFLPTKYIVIIYSLFLMDDLNPFYDLERIVFIRLTRSNHSPSLRPPPPPLPRVAVGGLPATRSRTSGARASRRWAPGTGQIFPPSQSSFDADT